MKINFLNNFKKLFNPVILQALLTKLDKKDKNLKYLVFKPFENLNPEDIKVVIFGTKPYSDENFNGLAFGCACELSPSLREISKTIKKLYNDSIIDDNKDLMYLKNQGVLLLNMYLILNDKNIYIWNTLILDFIKSFSINHKNIVYLLWGSQCQSFSYLIHKKNNLILKSPHPVYLFKITGFWNCMDFKIANDYLKNNNKLEIKW